MLILAVYSPRGNCCNASIVTGRIPVQRSTKRRLQMKITLIGSGNMGSALATQIAKAGHALVITGRNADKAKELARTTGAVFKDHPAAEGADVVVVATAYPDAVAALGSAGDLKGKVIVDITNPLTADYTGLTIGHSTSAAEGVPWREGRQGVQHGVRAGDCRRRQAGRRDRAGVLRRRRCCRQGNREGAHPEHGVCPGGCRRVAQCPLSRAARRVEHLLRLRRWAWHGHRSRLDRHAMTGANNGFQFLNA